jgi:molybdate transport system substrate-binding protein
MHAPYGRAAVEALKKEGLYEQVKDKFLVGENISQAAQYVGTGNTDAGIIALSLAFSMKDRGRYIEIPLADYTPIEQSAVILKRCKDKQTAKAFFEFLKTPAVRNILVAHGFTMPN